jgi:hypothetical protein
LAVAFASARALRRGVRRLLLPLLVVAVGACGGGDESGSDIPEATVPTAAPSTASPTTTAPADPYAIPAQIDAAYLNRVFEALERVIGDAARIIVTQQAYPPEAADRLYSVYTEDEFQDQTRIWLDAISGGLRTFRSSPGDRLTTVKRIVSASRSCVFVEAIRDHSRTASEPVPPRSTYVALRPKALDRDRAQLNPTPWIISGEGYNADGSQPPDPCA